LTLVEVLVLIVVALILIALLLPSWDAATVPLARKTQCASNLKQISTLAEMYRSLSGTFSMPEEMGAEWFRPLMSTAPSEIFQCAAEGNPNTRVDYRGPSRNMNRSKREDFFAGDKLGNHGKEGIYGITKAYSIVEITPDDKARWDKYLEDTRE
jgi:type II secretory pathway pseudopilin PulG